MASKVTFNGPNKLIVVKEGVTNIDVQIDLYSEWKHWLTEGDNSKYDQAFRTFGGDPTNTEETQFAPRYFFLTNGWKVFIDGSSLVVQINLYTDDGSSPYIVINNGSVSARNSDAQIIKNDIEKVLDYQNTVYIDVNSNNYGIVYPTGTAYSPVNNLKDALLICELYNFKQITLLSNLVADVDAIGYKFSSLIGSLEFNPNSYNFNNSLFDRLIITGDFNSSQVNITQCYIKDIFNFSGLMYESIILANNIGLANNSTINIHKCSSSIPGNDHCTIDMNILGETLMNIREFSGGLGFSNCGEGSIGTIEMSAGKVYLESSCTSGLLSIRGNAILEDNSMGTAIDDKALITTIVRDNSSLTESQNIVLEGITPTIINQLMNDKNEIISSMETERDIILLELEQAKLVIMDKIDIIPSEALSVEEHNKLMELVNYDDKALKNLAYAILGS